MLFLEELALSAVGCDLTTTSPGASFIGKKIAIISENSLSRKEGRITSIISGRGVPVTEERFSIGLISGSRRAGDTYELTKNEVVLRLAENKEEQLKESKEWELYLSLTQFRVLKTMHLLLDVEHHLAITSKVLQKTNIAPTDMYNAFERLYEDLDLLKTVDGLAL